MPVSGCGGVVASETGLLVGESIASWSADFHLSHLSKFLRPPLPPRRSTVACTASNPIARTTTTYWPLSRTGSENAPVGLTGDGSRPGGTSDRLTDAWVTGAKLYSSTTRPYTVPAPSFVWLHASADLPDGGEGKHGVGSKTSTRRKQPNSEIVSAPVRQTSKDGRLIHNQTSEQRLWPPNARVQLQRIP